MIDITNPKPNQSGDRVHTDPSNAPADAIEEPSTGLVEVEDECGNIYSVTPEEAAKLPKPRDYGMEWYHWLILIILIILIIICLIYGLVYVALALLIVILLLIPVGQELLNKAICAFADIVREVGSALDETFGISDLLKKGVMFLGIALVAYFAIKAFTGRKEKQGEDKTANDESSAEIADASETLVNDSSSSESGVTYEWDPDSNELVTVRTDKGIYPTDNDRKSRVDNYRSMFMTSNFG